MLRSLVSILGIGGAIGLFFLYTKPTYDRVGVLKAQIVEYEQALTKANELKKLRDTLMARFNAFNPDDIKRLHKMLPDHVDNVRLVLDLDSMASRYGLALQNVVVSGADSGAVEQTVIAAIGASTQPYESRTISFAVEGTYGQFNSFMEDLEKSLRIVDLTSLSMDGAQQQSAGEPVYRFQITLQTYWLKRL